MTRGYVCMIVCSALSRQQLAAVSNTYAANVYAGLGAPSLPSAAQTLATMRRDLAASSPLSTFTPYSPNPLQVQTPSSLAQQASTLRDEYLRQYQLYYSQPPLVSECAGFVLFCQQFSGNSQFRLCDRGN